MKLSALLLSTFFLALAVRGDAELPPRWEAKRASDWYAKQPWLVGANYAPAYAGNQLEMWQPDTFNLPAIERELGWARSLGFNTLRVFLHDLAWRQDPAGFLHRVEQFLGAADRHGMKVMFVIFDGVWNPYPRAGRQPEPRPHTHNSVWLQSPGREILEDESAQDRLEPYVKDVVGRFARDPRVIVWDLFNEPDNPNATAYGRYESPRKAEAALSLLRKVFRWAREINPDQPLTAGVWHGNWNPADGPVLPMTEFMLAHSDVISFHDYNPPGKLGAQIAFLQTLGRPLLCTEYMARPRGSRFDTALPLFRTHRVGAYNWGLVAGRSQTIYPWDSWTKTYTAEPPEWFHDVFRGDGTPYRPAEAEFLKGFLRR